MHLVTVHHAADTVARMPESVAAMERVAAIVFAASSMALTGRWTQAETPDFVLRLQMMSEVGQHMGHYKVTTTVAAVLMVVDRTSGFAVKAPAAGVSDVLLCVLRKPRERQVHPMLCHHLHANPTALHLHCLAFADLLIAPRAHARPSAEVAH